MKNIKELKEELKKDLEVVMDLLEERCESDFHNLICKIILNREDLQMNEVKDLLQRGDYFIRDMRHYDKTEPALVKWKNDCMKGIKKDLLTLINKIK